MKKIVKTAIISFIILLTAALTLTGCNQKLTVEEGRSLLSEGIENALASDTYYIKYRQNDNTSANGKYVQYSLNVQGETAKFTVATGDIIKTVYEDTYYGKSLKSGVEEKKASESDYKTGMLSYAEDKWQLKECTFAEFLNDEKIKGYNMESVSGLLKGLTEEELQISSVTRTGKVVYITAKVLKEGNPLAAYDGLNIRVVNDKLAYIGDTKESFNISIAYGGPNINIPAWSSVTE